MNIGSNRVMKAFVFLVTISVAQNFFAQNFSSFFIDFLRYPDQQTKHVKFPYRTGSGVIKSASSYSPIRFVTKNNIPILCIDSLDHISHAQSANVSIINMAKGTSMLYSFDKRKGGWLLTSQRKGKSNGEDPDFITFLKQYSKDEALQMKRTIFPFPYRIHKGGKNGQPETKLLMPREWESFDFIAMFPSICLFASESIQSGNNRRLFVAKNGRINLFFNFIKINKKWYLIEMEEYK